MSARPAKSTRSPVTVDQPSRLAAIAISLFLEHGYEATPVSLIAKQAGLTKAGLYHYFQSKEDILYFIHKRHLDDLLTPMIEEAERESDPEKRLRKFLSDYALLHTSDSSLQVMINETKQLSPKHRKEIKAAWRRALHLARDAIAELKRLDRCEPGLHPTYSAFGAIGMCSWICNWFDHSRPKAGPQVAKTMVDIFMQGLLRRDGS